ncbi:cell division protein FtsQ/DivIB [Fusibacter sp. JL216-2]|uniref:cell division protein FtsQ/DivIB n=1 Tax=Fusibacter sp. JL216-2 TaxID=3071453 RepID=UPI003D325CF5
MSDEKREKSTLKRPGARKKTLVFTLILLIIGSGLLVFKTNLFVVKKFEYPASVYFSDNDIRKYGGLDESSLYFNVSVASLEEKIVRHPYIKSVKIEKALPDKLILDIEYRQELAAIKYSGLYVTIDEHLTVLKVEESIGDIFLIDGFEFKSFNIGEELKVEESRVLRRTVQLISLLKNSHIEAKPYIRYDNGIELLLNDAYRVRFGKGQDIERKFNNFVDIYEELSEKGVQSGIIDVSHNGLPIFKPFGQ